MELMFLFAEQARRSPDEVPLRVTPQSVLERLQAAGVRSGNGSRLVGRDAVYESFARLRSKGYIRRIVESDPETGKRTGVVYEFYDWPAWNPDAPPMGESLQVESTSGIAGSGDAGSRAGKRAKKRSPQVGSTSGIAGSGDAGSSPSPQVGSTSGIAGYPPHPPEEEVGTTSPSPHKNATASRREKQATPDVAPDAASAAAEFLRKLPGKWAAGLQRSENLAPWLVRNAELTGWELNMELRHYLVRPEPGRREVENFGAVLAYRIKNMQDYEQYRQSLAEPEESDEQQEQAPDAPLALEWCGKCDSADYRWIAPEAGPARRCPDCHPQAARSGRS
ncbi:hypothetical protein [Streptomyces sp. NPDC056982]|uniref:hypothetical protein n=1 Tax=Streptomyces sp. NPDC056982 TaxID=3345986 RepID=UPI00363090A2